MVASVNTGGHRKDTGGNYQGCKSHWHTSLTKNPSVFSVRPVTSLGDDGRVLNVAIVRVEEIQLIILCCQVAYTLAVHHDTHCA